MGSREASGASRASACCLLLEVADNGQRWGRARRAERAEHLPAACCLLVVLEVAMVDMLLMVDMVRRMAGKWVARGERSEPSICLLPTACCLLPGGGFMWLYVALCGFMWLYVALCD